MKTIKKLLNWIEVRICMWATSEEPVEIEWECEPRDQCGRFESKEPQQFLRQEYLKHQQ